MSKQDAQQQAVQLTRAKLANVDFKTRCDMLGLGTVRDNRLQLRVFGNDMLLDGSDLKLQTVSSGAPAKLGDQILLLHYLLSEVSAEPTGDLITFRELPGGQFYWQPFLSRSVKPLVKRIGNDLDLLRKNLDRFDWQTAPLGDLGARVHALGKLEVTLVYRQGDEEFSPTAEVLFDSSVKRIYGAEDVAFMAGRICLGLL